MAKIHLRQATVLGNISKFTYSAWPITKNKESSNIQENRRLYVYL